MKDFFAEKMFRLPARSVGATNSYDSPYRRLKERYFDKGIARGTVGGEPRIGNLHGANMAMRRSSWEQVRDSVSTDPKIHEDIDLAMCLREYDIEIAQLSDLYVDISPRRALTPPLEFAEYSRSVVRTYEQLHEQLTPEIVKLVRWQWLFHRRTWRRTATR